MGPPNKKRRVTRKEEMNVKKKKEEKEQSVVSKEETEMKKKEEAELKEETKKREAIRKLPKYIEILRKIEKLKSDNRDVFPRKYTKNKAPIQNPDFFDFKDEVLTRTDTETPADWDKIEAKTIEGKYKVDAVVGSEARNLGEDFADETEWLLKWSEYPVATFESSGTVTGLARIEHEVRTLQVDLIELYIRVMRGEQYFEATFPNRYLKSEGGQGEWRYVRSQRARYRTKLRAIESYFNKINREWGLPLVYIEDWTILPMKDALKAIQDLIYLQENRISREVAELMKKYPESSLAHIKCKHTGGQCRHGSNDTLPCCGKAKSMVVVNQVPYFSNAVPKGKSQKEKKDLETRIECTDECACSPDNCDNRSLQRGRQHELVIFRVPGVGWTLRCVNEIRKQEFVGEYCGLMQVGNSAEEAEQRYDFRTGYEVTDKKGKMVEVFIAGHREGNEIRYISHGCTSNIDTESSVVERNGLFLNRQGFYANRLIIAGEELAFDYFPDMGPESDVDFSAMFDYCLCGSPACRFTKEKVKAAQQKKAANRAKGNQEEELQSDEEAERKSSTSMAEKSAKMAMKGGKKRTSGRFSEDEDLSDEGPSTSKSMRDNGCSVKRGARRDNPGCSSWDPAKCDEEADKRNGPYPSRRVLSPSDDDDEEPSTSNGNKRNGAAAKAGPSKHKRARASFAKKSEDVLSSDEEDE